MSKEKQIEEMFNIIVDGVIDGENNHGVPTGKTCLNIAQALYEAGYRKQSEGEWILQQNGKGVCSKCNRQDNMDELSCFCRYCGASMRRKHHE